MTRSDNSIHLKLCSWLPSMSQNSSSFSLCFGLTVQGRSISKVPRSFHLAKRACQASSYGQVFFLTSQSPLTTGSYERGLEDNQWGKQLLAALQWVSIKMLLYQIWRVYFIERRLSKGFSWWLTCFHSSWDWLQLKFNLPTGLAGDSSVLLLIWLVDVVKSRFLLYSTFLSAKRLN